ncbi:MAG: calcium-binding protein [Pseudomonadota bacterium]
MVNIISGDGSDENLRGEAGVSNEIAGNNGDDVIRGRGKADLLLGGRGNDTLFGANGADEMFGGRDDDVLNGGNGGDTLSGDRGTDILVGGNGNDVFSINADLAGDSVDHIQDFDVDRGLRKMTFNDRVEIKNVGGQAFVFQEQMDGTVTLSIAGDHAATFKGSEGSPLHAADVLARTDFVGGSPSTVSLLDNDGHPIQFRIRGGGGDDEIGGKPGIENSISGRGGDDVLGGQGRSDTLLGGPGDDTLNGRNGSDVLFGGGDDDELIGGNGGDMLSGDLGFDILTGGNGADTFRFNDNQIDGGTAGVDVITDFQLGVDKIEIFNADGGEAVAVRDEGGDAILSLDGEDFAVVQGVAAASLTVGVDVLI